MLIRMKLFDIGNVIAKILNTNFNQDSMPPPSCQPLFFKHTYIPAAAAPARLRTLEAAAKTRSYTADGSCGCGPQRRIACIHMQCNRDILLFLKAFRNTQTRTIIFFYDMTFGIQYLYGIMLHIALTGTEAIITRKDQRNGQTNDCAASGIAYP